MKPISRVGDIPEGITNRIKVGSKEFLASRTGNSVSICSHTCPHGGADLTEGLILDHELICPLHHARFRLHDGKVTSPPALDNITTFETEVKSDAVFVGRPNPSFLPQGPWEAQPSYIIIGAGAAGSACAVTLRSVGFKGKVILISEESEFPYDRTRLSKQALFEDGAVSTLRDEGFYQVLGIDIIAGIKVESIRYDQRRVILNNGTGHNYDKLCIASGARARCLRFPGSELDNVFTLRTAADATKIRSAILGSNHLTLVGAGFLNLELAAAAVGIGKSVTVVAPERIPLAQVFGQRMGEKILVQYQEAGIEWRLQNTIDGIVAETGASRVTLSDKSSFSTNAVVISAGIEPNTDFLSGVSWASEHGVKVDDDLRTPDPHIWAAGDVASLPMPQNKGRFRSEHWVTAMRQGRDVAISMWGHERKTKEVPFFWAELMAMHISAVGCPSSEEPEIVLGNIDEGEFLALWKSCDCTTGAFSIGYHRELIEIENELRKR